MIPSVEGAEKQTDLSITSPSPIIVSCPSQLQRYTYVDRMVAAPGTACT